MLRNLNVIKSECAPKDKTALWLKKENGKASLFWFDGLEWAVLTSNSSEDGDKQAAFDVIYSDGSDESKAANLEILKKYGVDKSVPVLLQNKNGQNVVGNYYNGAITTLVDDALHVIDISFETGDITGTADIDISKLEEYTHLEIGDSAEVKAINLEQLKTGPQMVSIDYGFGVANWNSSTGGEAHITTAQGVEVYYTIGVDGTVTKSGEIGKDSVFQNLNQEQYNILVKIFSGQTLTKDEFEIAESYPNLLKIEGVIPTYRYGTFKEGGYLITVPYFDGDAAYISIVGIKNDTCEAVRQNFVLATKKDTKTFTTKITMSDNIYISTAETTTLAITEGSSSFEECVIYFKTGTTAPTITLPDMKWANNDVPSFKASKGYELNIKSVNLGGTQTLLGCYAEYTV